MADFHFERRVEFCETDAAGIAHFSSIAQYMEQAEHALLRSVGQTVFQTENGGITWPRVHFQVDFYGPARFEEILDIRVHITKLGEHSIRYHFHISGPRGPVAAGELVAVCCERRIDGNHQHVLKKVKIPESIRNSLQQFLVERTP